MIMEDCDYVINLINYMFLELNIIVNDIEFSWVGLCLLIYEEGKDFFEILWKDEIWIFDLGLIIIVGGKLIGYRKMVEYIVDFVCDCLKEEGEKDFGLCKMKNMLILGGYVGGLKNFMFFVIMKIKEGIVVGLLEKDVKQLVIRYGFNVECVFNWVEVLKDEVVKCYILVYIFVEVEYSIEEEMIVIFVDFFVCRMGCLFFDINWVRIYKDVVIDFMSE